jgi:hypothetical protein
MLGAAVCAGVLAGQGAWTGNAWAQSPPGNLEGKWEGVLGGQLRLQLDFAKLADGSWSGKLNSLDQGAVLPIGKVDVEGNKVRFEVPSVGGEYEGTFNAAGDELQGTWRQTAVPMPQPLNFRRLSTLPGQAAAPAGQAAPGPKPITVPLDTVAPMAPTAFLSDGKTHLVYELHVNNYGRSDTSLVKVEVLGGDKGEAVLARYPQGELEGMVDRPGQPSANPKTKMGAGAFAVVYVWVTMEKAAEVPGALRHRLTARVGSYPEDLVVVTPPTPVNRKAVMVIQPPLRGDNWLAGNGPSNTSGHRRALIPVDGRAWIAQRFAIDWVQLYPEGKTFAGNPRENKNYRCYGVDALAVAPGVVTEVKDGIPENTPGDGSRAVPITLETIGGNHVIVDLGGGVFAFYAHFQPGTIQVKAGDKVTTGQVLGKVGNSGNSSEPHLHFDLCDRNSMLACEGIPYAFPSFGVQGSGWGWKAVEEKAAAVARTRELPLENQVVRFPAGGAVPRAKE